MYKKLKVTAAFLLFMFAQYYYTQTYVSGLITTNTIWDTLNDPYIISGNTLVTDSVKLTILPGTVVKFYAQKALQINGELNAIGTDSARITFTANNTNPSAGYWDAIIFTSTSQASNFDASGNYLYGNIIENADLEYGGYLQSVNNGDATIEGTGADIFINKCTISNSGTDGIRLTGASSGETYLTNNVINNSGIQLVSHNSYKHITNNQLNGIGNTYSNSGIMVYHSSGIYVTHNILRDTYFGLHIYNCDNGEITNNIIIGGDIAESVGINYVSDNSVNSMEIAHNLIIGKLKNIFDNALLNNNVFVYNQRAITQWGGQFPILSTYKQNHFVDCNSSGLTQDNSSCIIYLSRWQTANKGLHLFTENLFEGNYVNSDFGLIEDNYTKSGLEIYNNNFIANYSPYLLKNGYSSGDIEAQDNYWGTTNVSTISNKIWDWFDDASKTFVNINPILFTPDTNAPISRPNIPTVVKTCNGKALFWDVNPELDTKGYKIHYGNFNGYSYEHTIDILDTTVFEISSLFQYDTIAITAYDNLADGLNDLTEGHESWFRFVALKNPHQQLNLLGINDDLFCQGDTLTLDGGTGYVGYLWSNGDSTSTAKITTPGEYSLIATDSYNIDYCDTIQLSWQDIYLDLGNDTVVNWDDTIVLNAYYPNASYLWSDSTSGSTIAIDSAGTYWVEVTTQMGCLFSDSINANFDLQVSQNDFGSSLTLYPNPADDYFIINLNASYTDIHVNVKDLTGKHHISKQYAHHSFIQMDISDLANGVYIIDITSDTKKAVLKIIKE